ncbi:MAG TPA: T9SS type A sorting domain-containing protein [Bacteroidia bacterium]|nr:T9SS type A sorting domain-containing protein [Bacteroidia bacterium]
MKIKLFAAFLIWVCGFGNTVNAQKENNIWYFGYHAGLDFNSGAPVTLTNGALFTGEGCSSISDSNGTLLFYTDGITVWDRNHAQMPNGDSLKGGQMGSSTQSALIVPFPGNNFMYYIFTVGEVESLPIEFNYSVVDMSLNSGNGDVSIKNNFLMSPVTEKLTAVKHSNNIDIWVMVHGVYSNSFICYLVSASGISPVPVISNIGAVIPDSSLDAVGYMKFSIDGTKIAYAAYVNNYVDLFDFNSTTGIVSNEKYLTFPGGSAYGLEFSSNGNFLYATGLQPPQIYQWDITSNIASVINSTQQLVGVSTTTPIPQIGALQIAPDGKIYVAHTGKFFLGVINDPDLPGILCNYNDSVLSLNGYVSTHGLPNFMTSYFLTTGINTNNPPQNQLTISPSPATGKIYISFPATVVQTITTKIFSLTGEVVYEQKNKSAAPITRFQIPIYNISNGIYFLSVRTSSESEQAGREVVTKKIVVQH